MLTLILFSFFIFNLNGIRPSKVVKSSSCNVSIVNQRSPYVIPFKIDHINVTGCESSVKTKKNRDVHVIVVNSTIRGRNPTVSLLIEGSSSSSNKYSDRANKRRLVMALYSTGAVQWNVSSKNLPEDASFLFWLSTGSRLIQSRHRSKTKASRSSNKFLQAIIKKYSSISSYSIMYEQPSSIHLNIESANMEDECDVTSTKPSQAVRATVTREVPVTGCYSDLNTNIHHREMHVVFLNRRPTANEIFVEIVRRSDDRSSVNKDIVLFLKTVNADESLVVWKIISRNVEGKILILSDSKIEIESSSQDLLFVASDNTFPTDYDSLVEHSRRMNSTLTSYSEFNRADKIDISVNTEKYDESNADISMLDHPMELIKRERSSFFNIVDSSKNLESSTSSTSILPSFTTKSIESDVENKKFRQKINGLQVAQFSQSSEPSILIKPGTLSDIETLIIKSTFVRCLPNKAVVNLDKNVIDKILPKDLIISLSDLGCKADVNSTHYMLVTTLSDCGSTVLYQKNHIIVQNEVIFTSIPSPLRSLSSSYPAILTSNIRDDVTPVRFQCKYQLHQNKDSASNKVKFDMVLYKDKNFRKELIGMVYPVNVKENLTIYVDVTAEIEVPYLGISLNKCWLSSINRETLVDDSSASILIDKRCSVDESVKFSAEKNRSSRPNQKFSFKVDDKFVGAFVFIHCNFSLCHEETHPRLVRCVDPRKACRKKDSYSKDFNKKVILSHRAAGPLKVIGDKNTSRKTKDREWADGMMKTSGSEPKLRQPNKLLANKVEEEASTSSPSNPQKIVVVGLTTEVIVGIAFASFIIGAIFMGVLWCIYVKTEPRRQRRNDSERTTMPLQTSGYNLCPQSTFHSGSSTPNSQTPMSA